MRCLKSANGPIVLFLAISSLTTATAWGLDKPSHLKATSVTAEAVTLSWENKDPKVKGFRVQRSLKPDSEWVKAGFVAAPLTTFTDTEMPNGQTIYYLVRGA